jgi:RecA/RadA recombinase
VQLGEVTEVSGLAGSAKTQLVLQLLLDVQISTALGGCEGEAVLIDTEGACAPERLEEMASHAAAHIQRVIRKKAGDPTHAFADPTARAGAEADATAEAFLGRIHVARARSLAELNAALAATEELIRARASAAAGGATGAGGGGGGAGSSSSSSSSSPLLRPRPVRLVVVDSIAFHHRYGRWATQDVGARHRSLAQLGQLLNGLAARTGAAVVVTNQMTTKLGGGGGWGSGGGGGGGGGVETPARIAPALGDVWAHVPSTRILLGWDTGGDRPGHRVARILKHVAAPLPVAGAGGGGGLSTSGPTAHFKVLADGIRGLSFGKAAARRRDGEGRA